MISFSLLLHYTLLLLPAVYITYISRFYLLPFLGIPKFTSEQPLSSNIASLITDILNNLELNKNVASLNPQADERPIVVIGNTVFIEPQKIMHLSHEALTAGIAYECTVSESKAYLKQIMIYLASVFGITALLTVGLPYIVPYTQSMHSIVGSLLTLCITILDFINRWAIIKIVLGFALAEGLSQKISFVSALFVAQHTAMKSMIEYFTYQQSYMSLYQNAFHNVTKTLQHLYEVKK